MSAAKRMAYGGSNFATVRGFAEANEHWTLEKAKERKRVLAERITSNEEKYDVVSSYEKLVK